MADRNDSTMRGGEHVYEAFVEAGIDLLVGLPGTQTLPVDRIVAERDEVSYVMAHHETAIPHIAWGYYESGGGTAATLTVPGPGDTNAMHGLKNAYEDCVPIIHISADVNPEDRGKGPIHEIEHNTFDNAVKANIGVEHPRDLSRALERGIELAQAPPLGPVRLGIPSGVLDTEFAATPVTFDPERVHFDTTEQVEDAAALLRSAMRPLVYAGGGARRSSQGPRVVGELAEALDAPVVTTYKGKGVFPEDDPRMLGVTGSHFPAGARRVLDRADVVLALGTDFDGVTTAHWSLPMGERLIHVTLDPDAVDAAYEADVAIVDDVMAAGNALLSALSDVSLAETWDGATVASTVREEYIESLHNRGLFDGGPPLNTPEVLATVREVAPRETVVTTDVGGFRLWAKQVFEAYGPEEYVTAGSWAGMGVGLPAAIGAKLAHPDRPVVCLTGDGGLLMCIHELHTAATENQDVTVVVSNNSDYGIISKSPAIREYTDSHQFRWPSPEFVTIAEGFGCRGVAVETVAELREAMKNALAHDGPDLVDVRIQTDEPSAAEAAEYDSTVDLP